MHQPAWTESEDHSWRVGAESRELKGVALVGWFSYRGNVGGHHRVLAALGGHCPVLLVSGGALALNQEVSPAGGAGAPGPLDPEKKDVKCMCIHSIERMFTPCGY